MREQGRVCTECFLGGSSLGVAWILHHISAIRKFLGSERWSSARDTSSAMTILRTCLTLPSSAVRACQNLTFLNAFRYPLRQPDLQSFPCDKAFVLDERLALFSPKLAHVLQELVFLTHHSAPQATFQSFHRFPQSKDLRVPKRRRPDSSKSTQTDHSTAMIRAFARYFLYCHKTITIMRLVFLSVKYLLTKKAPVRDPRDDRLARFEETAHVPSTSTTIESNGPPE